MKKTIIALMALTGIVQAATVVTVAGINKTTTLPTFDSTTDTLLWHLASAKSDKYTESFTLSNGDLISYTIPGGKIFGDNKTNDSWSNTSALATMNLDLGTSFTTAELASLNHTYTGWQNSTTTVNLTINSAETGDKIVLYTLVSDSHTPLKNFSVTGLNDAVFSYAVCNGDGFTDTAKFSSSVNDWTMIRVEGTLTDSKRISMASTSAKYGYGMIAYISVPEPATATLSLLALAGLAMRRRRK